MSKETTQTNAPFTPEQIAAFRKWLAIEREKGCENTGYWPQRAEVHIKGMTSVSPDSCIFPSKEQERREADRWNFIHSEEDLPKEDGFYLVTIKYVESSSGKLKQNTSELYFSTGFQRWTDCGEEFDEDGVIAWKPMPEPCGESEVNDYDQNT